jgi:hypothetical protein
MNEPMPDVPMTPEPEQKSGGGNRRLIIVLVVLLVLCCCCVCVGAGAFWQYGDQWVNMGALRPLLALL